MYIYFFLVTHFKPISCFLTDFMFFSLNRRRADLLEPLNEKLSHSHYLLVIRQILFELGEIFSDMMDLKTKRWNEEPDNPHHAKKVNLMVSKAINYFIQFLDTMKTDGKHPDKYNDESVRPALLARFHLGKSLPRTLHIAQQGCT